MQIQSGRYKGRKLQRSTTGSIRPCSSRVKKSLFGILSVRMDFSGTKILDLFAGFGSLGYEALSRGAAEVCFVDKSTRSLQSLRETAAELGVSSQVKIVKKDVVHFIKTEKNTYDLVFCDPPYDWRDYRSLIREIFGRGLLAESGMLLIEHSNRYGFENEPQYVFHKDYGMTRVSFFS
ncbi:MAG: 16S rRNA (guanine(966)-N(2))-methyltransferase RsmD [Chlorobiales bacterium]|nr:16S rRNA (guanine(966)-N(2))-methyltransferase RsmD [Chlorobiales bacterium]